jgi:uncharacterized membrane protein
VAPNIAAARAGVASRRIGAPARLGHNDARRVGALTMTLFLAALAAFVFIHVGISATPLRGALVRGMGESGYRGVFSLVSAALLAALIFGYGAARGDSGNVTLYAPPDWARHVTHLLLLIAMLFVVIGVLTPGPTYAGFEGSVKQLDPTRGILRITRHPFMWGVVFWGAGHLLSNGKFADVALFGAMALMALRGMVSIDVKSAARNPSDWARFKNVTSLIPFAAIVAGRNKFAIGEMGWRIVAAVAIYAVLGYYHGVIFGAPAFVMTAGQ